MKLKEGRGPPKIDGALELRVDGVGAYHTPLRNCEQDPTELLFRTSLVLHRLGAGQQDCGRQGDDVNEQRKDEGMGHSCPALDVPAATVATPQAMLMKKKIEKKIDTRKKIDTQKVYLLGCPVVT